MFTQTQKTKRLPTRGKEIDKQLIETLDFRNAKLLSQFVSETGKILPKRKTGLSAKVHRKMVGWHLKLTSPHHNGGLPPSIITLNALIST